MLGSRRPPGLMPTSPWSQPLMTEPLPSWNLNGEPLSHEESNSLPSANVTPTYCIESWSPFLAALPLPTTMSLTTSFFGGDPVGFGIAGFVFVSFRFVDGGGVLGAGLAGMSAVVALPPPPPQPATAMAAAASTTGRWMRLFTDGQASD